MADNMRSEKQTNISVILIWTVYYVNEGWTKIVIAWNLVASNN
jgi:hypothetical protein